MLSTVQKCRENSDNMYRVNDRIYFGKQFSYNIVGLTENGTMSSRVNLVCKKLKIHWLVITTYHI